MDRDDLSNPPSDGALLDLVISDALDGLPHGAAAFDAVMAQVWPQLPATISLEQAKRRIAELANERGISVDLD